MNKLKKILPEAEMKLRLAINYLQRIQKEKNEKNEQFLLRKQQKLKNEKKKKFQKIKNMQIQEIEDSMVKIQNESELFKKTNFATIIEDPNTQDQTIVDQSEKNQNNISKLINSLFTPKIIEEIACKKLGHYSLKSELTDGQIKAIRTEIH